MCFSQGVFGCMDRSVGFECKRLWKQSAARIKMPKPMISDEEATEDNVLATLGIQ